MSIPQTQWILASSNAGKLKEFAHGLSPLLHARGVSLINQSELGIESSDEPFDRFDANALRKARHAAQLAQMPAIADDSGLCVDALGGAPGVRSARFFQDAQQATDPAVAAFAHLPVDEANLQWLLHRMRGQENRIARFCAVLVFVRSATDPDPVIAKGVWQGTIAQAPRGTQGFGYDPIFIDAASGLVAADMTLDQKQQVSHRGQALRSLCQQLSDRLA